MQKPEIPNIPAFGAPNGRSKIQRMGPRFYSDQYRESSPKTVIFVPEENVSIFAPPKASISVQKQKIHDCHVYAEIIGV